MSLQSERFTMEPVKDALALEALQGTLPDQFSDAADFVAAMVGTASYPRTPPTHLQ